MIPITPVVKQLLIINIIFFVGTNLLLSSELASSYFALYYYENPVFKAWQPLTHMFMHADIMHIFFNMFALYSFGSALEQFWGGKKFLFFYLSCGLGAALLHSLVNHFQFISGLNDLVQSGYKATDIYTLLNKGMYDNSWAQVLGVNGMMSFAGSYIIPAVGASGAVYGLLVAFAFMYPNAQLGILFIPVPVKAKYFVPIILLLDLFLGLKGSSFFASGSTGIAHFAHLGGAITGFIMMWYWKKNQFNRNRWN